MRRPRSDAGETLIELLISISIIGTSAVAILGGVLVSIDASHLDQRQIHAQALLRTWGEHVVDQTTDSTFQRCATVATYASATWAYTDPAPAGLETLPVGFTPQITDVTYWNGTGFGTGGCSDVQRLELTMTVDGAAYSGLTSKYDVVVRRPCAKAGCA